MNLEQLEKRYSVKKFDSSQCVEEEKIELLKKAFHLCPSSLNLQGWRLYVIKDSQTKSKIAELAGQDTNGARIKECSHFLVLCRRQVGGKHFGRVIDTTEILQIMMKKRGLSRFKMTSFFSLYTLIMGKKAWVTHQVYIALGFLLATCASLDIDCLPMEGIKKRKVDRVLGLSSEFKTVVALAVGVADQGDKSTNPSRLRKSRLPYDEVIKEV